MSHRNALRTPLWLSITGALLLLSGCATTQGTQGTAVDDEGDPLEGMNRAIYTFNENVDKVFFKPLATGYKNTLPQPVRTSVANFFNNLSYPIVILNDFLQAKFSQGLLDTGRFVMN
ncbi:MAG TPA: MlaA family lipoprotein, partial [Gammaproteobacteria bacterium]|nr:MlaA family lipoprotein [Gammaproteobacteria bacterium]